MNFMFEWTKRYLTSERSERLKYRFGHENIKFISLNQRVMFFFIIWRPDVVDIANLYFIALEKSSQFYKSPFVFIENTKHPCPRYKTLTEFQSNKIHEILVN